MLRFLTAVEILKLVMPQFSHKWVSETYIGMIRADHCVLHDEILAKLQKLDLKTITN